MFISDSDEHKLLQNDTNTLTKKKKDNKSFCFFFWSRRRRLADEGLD